jgi:DNA helicase-2/ATP-dependent DNA helicase PcrA
VAITRAETHCFLSYARTRFRYGRTEFANPSRFLYDIDTRFLQIPQEARPNRHTDEIPTRIRRERTEPVSNKSFRKTTVPYNYNASPANRTDLNFKTGQTVEHERFGIGEILKIEGEGENTKASILFKNAGNKQLLLRFARLQVVE